MRGNNSSDPTKGTYVNVQNEMKEILLWWVGTRLGKFKIAQSSFDPGF